MDMILIGHIAIGHIIYNIDPRLHRAILLILQNISYVDIMSNVRTIFSIR